MSLIQSRFWDIYDSNGKFATSTRSLEEANKLIASNPTKYALVHFKEGEMQFDIVKTSAIGIATIGGVFAIWKLKGKKRKKK